ncbi:hypothetical protein [Streptomyces sp. NPDC056983]|uniref:hypothetical protein n=1 Tax=Streptomyces sp. NPDC056983 TaxID=3345987 RepID=UPI00362F8930
MTAYRVSPKLRFVTLAASFALITGGVLIPSHAFALLPQQRVTAPNGPDCHRAQPRGDSNGPNTPNTPNFQAYSFDNPDYNDGWCKGLIAGTGAAVRDSDTCQAYSLPLFAFGTPYAAAFALGYTRGYRALYEKPQHCKIIPEPKPYYPPVH